MRAHKSVLTLIAVCILMMFAAPAFAKIIYVNATASGWHNGTSWAMAYTDLQAAISTAASGDEIWVAAGTYKPTTKTSQKISFEMKAGVGIYGGFVGIETARDQRDWKNNITTLSGNIGDPSISTDNSYHVVTSFGTTITGTAVLDGFTITEGNANDSNRGGGGMYNWSSSPTVANCTFFKNTSINAGGGMFNNNNSNNKSGPTVINCIFFKNSATFYGAGIYNTGSDDICSSPTLINCTFSGNTTGYGAGIYNSGNSSSTVTNCTFFGNYGTRAGGGIYNAGISPSLTNCTFFGNKTGGNGGGIYNISGNNAKSIVTNCTFSGNKAGKKGGGMYNTGTNRPTITNCILWNNLPDEVYKDSNSTPVINYSIVKGGYVGTGNLDTDPLFVSPVAPSSAPTSAGDYHLQKTSPAIDAGSDAAVPSGVTTDLDGNPRISGTAVNMGAYETVPSASEISVKQDTTDIASGGSHDFGSVVVGNNSGAITFIIENTGTADLSLSGTPKIVLSGTDVADFSVDETSTTSPVAASRMTTFTVTFTPSSDVAKTATLTIANDDSDEGTYTITLNGTGTVAPEINVKQGTTNIASAGSYNFGSVTVGSDSGAITFTIENAGNTDLSLTGMPKITLSGTNAADFSVDETLTTSPVATSGSTSFTITFTPSSVAIETATISIASDDSDENPYTVTLTGTGTDGTTIPPVIPGPPLPIVITAEISNITATGAASGGIVVYPEGCTALLLARGVAWDTVSPPTYPEDSATFDGWTSGEYASALTNLVPQTTYYIRAYVQYKLNGVVYTRYDADTYSFTTSALPGDVNGDKVLDLKDAVLALKIVAGAAGNAAINLPADVNDDGKIGVEEAVYVLQHAGTEG